MKQDVTFSQCTSAFHNHGRGDQFSYDALRVLFDYFEELDEQNTVLPMDSHPARYDLINKETELDVIGICCEYSEETWREIADYYLNSIDLSDCDDDDEREQTVLEYLHDRTMVCSETSAAIVYKDF